MTRDEAIAIEKRKLKLYMHDKSDYGIDKVAAANINALIELGLLKVEEPKVLVTLRGEFVNINEISEALFVQNVGYKLVKADD